VTGGIDPYSPAETSGLKPGDLIIEFGEIRKYNYKSVRESISSLCQERVGCGIPVLLIRKTATGLDERIKLNVVPQKWSGYGVLGCHFYDLIDKEGAFVKVQVGATDFITHTKWCIL
jgi:hypothetical protein